MKDQAATQSSFSTAASTPSPTTHLRKDTPQYHSLADNSKEQLLPNGQNGQNGHNFPKIKYEEGESFEDEYTTNPVQSFFENFYNCCLVPFVNCIDKDAFHFGARISATLTFASFFVFIRIPHEDGTSSKWPSPDWIYISTLMVSWFPRCDAASIIEKSFQRFIGTIVGGCLGLLCGLTSLLMPAGVAQGIYLAFCVAICTFSVVFFSGQLNYFNKPTKVLDHFSYAACLCLLTYGIAVFPFFDATNRSQWSKAIHRICNVTFGCIIGSVGSIVVLPRSTTLILHERIHKQCKLAGEASDAVLRASADIFSGKSQPTSLLRDLLESTRMSTRMSFSHRMSMLKESIRNINKDCAEDDGDVAFEKYEAAIKDWRVTKGLFTVLNWDPFHICLQDCKDYFKKKCAVALARALRIQTTVVLLDGMVRNDPQQHIFNDDILSLIVDIGTHIRQMLAIPHNREESKRHKQLLKEKLKLTRKEVIQLCEKVSEQPTGSMDVALEKDDEDSDDCCPESAFNNMRDKRSVVCDANHVYALLFLQLLEHLVLRSISLYNALLKVENAVVPLKYGRDQVNGGFASPV